MFDPKKRRRLRENSKTNMGVDENGMRGQHVKKENIPVQKENVGAFEMDRDVSTTWESVLG